MKGKVGDLRDEVVYDILHSNWDDAVRGLQELIELDVECDESIEDMIIAEVEVDGELDKDVGCGI